MVAVSQCPTPADTLQTSVRCSLRWPSEARSPVALRPTPARRRGSATRRIARRTGAKRCRASADRARRARIRLGPASGRAAGRQDDGDRRRRTRPRPTTSARRSSRRSVAPSPARRCARSSLRARRWRSPSATARGRSRAGSSSRRSWRSSTGSRGSRTSSCSSRPGTHRGNTDDELRAMLGDDVVDGGPGRQPRRARRRLADVDGHASVRDVPVWLNTEWVEADVRITTGFVEPHFFAGFSGGPKMVAPGLAGLETVLTLHDAARIGHPTRALGDHRGQPVHDDVRAIAAAHRHRLRARRHPGRGASASCAAFGGELAPMHRAACARGAGDRDAARSPHRFDVVVTSNSGFPLDQNLYQAVKGMSAAAQVVKPGGTDRLRRRVPRRIPRPRLVPRAAAVGRLAAGRCSPTIAGREQTVARPVAGADPGRHPARRQGARPHVVPLGRRARRGTPRADARHAATVAEALAAAGPTGRVCVLPEGPQTIPYIA